MTPNQLAAIVLSVLAMGAGAVGAAQVSGDVSLGPPPWANDDRERDINVSLDGNVTPGETVALTAALDGEPVPHAPVEVNGELVGETDADGRIDVTVPAGADEFEVEVEPDFEGSTTVPLEDEETDEDEGAEAEDDDEAEEDDADEADDEAESEDNDDGSEADDEDDERPIDLAVDGNVTPNETVTVIATVNGTPLANAAVSVNREDVGTTDANGTIQVTVPAGADEFEVEAEYDHAGKVTVAFDEADEDQAADDEEADDEDDERELDVTVDGNVSAGGTVTVTVIHDGTPVENATVTVNDERVGTTNADGQLAVTLSDDLGDEVEVEVEADDGEGEWERAFEGEEDEAAEDDGGSDEVEDEEDDELDEADEGDDEDDEDDDS